MLSMGCRSSTLIQKNRAAVGKSGGPAGLQQKARRIYA
jgi:hypothetical protein